MTEEKGDESGKDKSEDGEEEASKEEEEEEGEEEEEEASKEEEETRIDFGVELVIALRACNCSLKF